MASRENSRVFDPAIVDRFRLETARRTRRFSLARRFLNRVADVMEGTRKPDYYIDLNFTGIVLDYTTRKRWSKVENVCDAVPGIRGTVLEFGNYYGIRRSTIIL